jgi:hypothetical protein
VEHGIANVIQCPRTRSTRSEKLARCVANDPRQPTAKFAITRTHHLHMYSCVLAPASLRACVRCTRSRIKSPFSNRARLGNFHAGSTSVSHALKSLASGRTDAHLPGVAVRRLLQSTHSSTYAQCPTRPVRVCTSEDDVSTDDAVSQAWIFDRTPRRHRYLCGMSRLRQRVPIRLAGKCARANPFSPAA